VLVFLEKHPDFLQHQAEKLGLKPCGERVVISLADRQMLELKDRNRQLEARLQQLIRHGEANDLIQARTHQLTRVLLSARQLEPLLESLASCFDSAFRLDRLAVKLWHPRADPNAGYSLHGKDIQAMARNLSAPYCGPYVNDEVLSWLPAMPVLQSFCQLALRDEHGETFGILVLASDDPDRFTFDMHTHYLAQIGELISLSLMRVLGPL